MIYTVSPENIIRVFSQVGLEDNPVLKEALKQVLQSQGAQKSDDGSLQVEQHILPVTLEIVQLLWRQKQLNPEIVATALLHDVLEDDPNIDENLFRERFGSRIYNNVKILTKQDWKSLSGKSESAKKAIRDKIYFEKLETAPEEVILVKLADRLNNVARLESSPEKGKKERYIQETINHYLPLAEKHSQYFNRKLREELDRISIN